MKNGLVQVQTQVASTYSPNVDQNKRFLKMVRITIMLNDGGV